MKITKKTFNPWYTATSWLMPAMFYLGLKLSDAKFNGMEWVWVVITGSGLLFWLFYNFKITKQ